MYKQPRVFIPPEPKETHLSLLYMTPICVVFTVSGCDIHRILTISVSAELLE